MAKLVSVFLTVSLFKFAMFQDLFFLQDFDKQAKHELLFCKRAKQDFKRFGIHSPSI